jgi:hypothetical protein
MGKIDWNKPLRWAHDKQPVKLVGHYYGEPVLGWDFGGPEFGIYKEGICQVIENVPEPNVYYTNAYDQGGAGSFQYKSSHDAERAKSLVNHIGILKITYDPTTGAKSVEFVE